MPNRNTGPAGTLTQVDIDVKNLGRSDQFWATLLGPKVAEQEQDYLSFARQGAEPRLYIQKVPEKRLPKPECISTLMSPSPERWPLARKMSSPSCRAGTAEW